MKHLLLLALTALPLSALALSRSIERDIEFPKGYNEKKASAIRQIIQDKQFKFVDGLVSYWPPDWATRLSFEGDSASLITFLNRIRELDGISLRAILYEGRSDEQRQDSDWQLDFSHARPNQLTVYINLRAKNLDFAKLVLPEWPPKK